MRPVRRARVERVRENEPRPEFHQTRRRHSQLRLEAVCRHSSRSATLKRRSTRSSNPYLSACHIDREAPGTPSAQVEGPEITSITLAVTPRTIARSGIRDEVWVDDPDGSTTFSVAIWIDMCAPLAVAADPSIQAASSNRTSLPSSATQARQPDCGDAKSHPPFKENRDLRLGAGPFVDRRWRDDKAISFGRSGWR